jgi:hypothetical protein
MAGEEDVAHQHPVLIEAAKYMMNQIAQLGAYRALLGGDLPQFLADLREISREQLPCQFFLADVMVIHGSLGNPGLDGDLTDGGLPEPALDEQAHRRTLDPLLGISFSRCHCQPK